MPKRKKSKIMSKLIMNALMLDAKSQEAKALANAAAEE